MEKQLRCKDCKVCVPDRWRSGDGDILIEFVGQYVCASPHQPGRYVNPGQFACNKFVYPDK